MAAKANGRKALGTGTFLPPQPAWTPFEEVDVEDRESGPMGRVYENSRYTVVYREYPGYVGVCICCAGAGVVTEAAGEVRCRVCEGRKALRNPDLRQLAITRLDGKPVRFWRDLQRIKNELLGEEDTGWEIFPPESQLMDNSNRCHIWSMPGVKLPSPYAERFVTEVVPTSTSTPQEPWEEGTRPDDAFTERAPLIRQLHAWKEESDMAKLEGVRSTMIQAFDIAAQACEAEAEACQTDDGRAAIRRCVEKLRLMDVTRMSLAGMVVESRPAWKEEEKDEEK